MRRFFFVPVVVLSFVLVPAGCTQKTPKKDPTAGNVELTLPESSPAPSHAPERVSKLTVDGKDYSEPRATKRTLQVETVPGAATVSIEYSFWPNTYTNIIRTKVVTLAKDKSVNVDFSNEDPNTPDKIKPIYFPTPTEVVEAMCKLGNVGANDIVHDIGSGDGRLVILAVKKFDAKKGVGVDIDADLVKKSWENAKKEGVEKKVEFRAGDALEIKDFSEASVVLLYVGEDLNLKLRPILQKTLKPGSRVVSHRFRMGDWEPDRSITITAKNNSGEKEDYRLHLWTIK